MAVALTAMVSIEMVGGAPAAQALPATATAASATADQAAQLLALVNNDRAGAGLAPLHARSDAAAIAQDWTNQMVAAGTLSHNDAYFTSETRSALNAQALGENVGFSGSMAAVEYGFMNSPHHRDNILDPRYTALGIGVVQASNGSWWVTQDFLQEAAPVADDPAPVADEPAPVATAADAEAARAPAPSDPVPSSAPEPEAAPSEAAAPAADAPVGSPMLLALPGSHSADETAPPAAVLAAGAALLGADILGLFASRRRRAAKRS